MTLAEAARLLAFCAAFDRRTVGKADALAWQVALEDVPFEEAKEAAVMWYRDHREWIMPADVHNIVRLAHSSKPSDRTLDEALTVPAADPDDVAGYIAAIRAGQVKEPEERTVARPEITAQVREMWKMPKDVEEG